MKRIPSFFEAIISVALLLLGIHILFNGSSSVLEKNNELALIVGAPVFVAGGLLSVSNVRDYIWHWRMLRRSGSSEEI
jgi:hypothetical protein